MLRWLLQLFALFAGHRSSVPKPVVEEIEPRILYSADANPLLWGGVDPNATAIVAGIDGSSVAAQTVDAQQQQQRRREIVFVDAAVADAQTLIDGLIAQRGGGVEIEVVQLRGDADGLAQIDAVLAGEHGLDAVHIVSHGEAGRLQLGNTFVDGAALQERASSLAAWSQALSADADILLFGCDVGEGVVGQRFIGQLATLTGADVAASSDATGHESLGGNWMLEVRFGSIESALAPSAGAQQAWHGLLDISTGLVANWRFDANAGDSSGSGFNGTLTNGAAIDSAAGSNKIGPGKLALDGSNDYVELSSHQASFAAMTQGTIAGWIRTTGVSGQIFAISDIADGDSDAGLRVGSAGVLVFDVWENNTRVFDVRTTVTVNDGNWHHVAVTVGPAGNRLYIDGVQAAVTYNAGNASSTTFLSAVSGVDNASIGRDVNSSGARFHFNGLLDDVRIYNRALTAGDITQLAAFTGSAITVTPTSGLSTTEGGGTAQFSVVLDSAPTANVTIAVSSNDSSEGTVSTSLLTFTSANWSTPQTVTVTGVNDALADGFQPYSIVLGAASSADASYNGLNPNDVQLANVDDDINYGLITVNTVADTADGDTSSLAALAANRGADGAISLREAIIAANNTVNGAGGADRIHFDIAGAGPHTIALASALPAITGAVIIDATTEPNYTANTPVVRIDGVSAGASNGLTLNDGSDGSVIRGLMITRFSGDGIFVQAGADGVTIAGNWIGTTGTGSTGVGNGDDGIELAGSNAIIGGTGANDRNVITNSADEGINIVGAGVTGHLIQGNYIGVDPDGASGGGNNDVGIAIISGSGNTIGGTTAAARNVISRNWEGFEVNSANNTIQGNYVGTDASGTLNRGNRIGDGIQIQGSANNTVVGGSAAGAGNLIAYNAGDGVSILAGTGHQVLGNTFFANADLGIDLGTSGVSANDLGDGDGGANGLQNFPLLMSANSNSAGTTIAGSLNSTAATTYRIEFYANRPTVADAANGEGERWLGFINVTTDGAGNATISTTLASVWVNSGDRVTATATNLTTNDTSEFAANVSATSSGIVVVDTINDVVDGTTTSIAALGGARGADGRISLREAVIASNNGAGNDTIILAAGTYTLTIAGANDDSSATGDLDIQTNITIAGAGMASTIISGGGIDRVMEVDGVGNLTLNDVRLTGGSINNDGGGLLVEQAGGTATLTRVEVTGNAITGGARIGGGIHNVGTLNLTDSLVHGNTATGSDGGGISNLGTATIARSSIFGNSARYGGGLHQLAGAMTIENATVSGNTASAEGGGIDVAAGTLNVRYSTVAANSALGGNGGGAMVRAGTLTALSSIFADNSSTTGGRDLHGTFTSLGYNIIEHNAGFTGAVGTDQLGTDPALAALALDAASGQYVHALGAGSIAINVGGTTPPATDQRGVTRDASADVGAYERVNSAPVLDNTGTMTLTTIDEDQTNNAGDLVSGLISSAGGDRITDANGDPEGIAITSLVSGNGSWEYSITGGASWITIGTVTNASALLLRSTDRVRFVPNAAAGTSASITFRAWDRTTGTQGTKVSTASNGGGSAFSTATEDASITVNAVNDAPVITSNGGAGTAAVNAAENSTAVTTVTSTDVDGGAAVYSITGGLDAARFTINASTGALAFVAAPNYEAPADSGANNVYDVTVQVSDGAGGTDTQAIAVTVTPVNDNAPVITSNGGGASAAISVAENQTAVTTVTATDADLPAQTVTYSIVGGADAALFSINASTGALTFISGRNYEAPTDAGADNIYDVIVQADDGAGSTDTQAIAVSVTPVNEASPVITSNGGGATAAISIAENTSAVTTVTATDADLPAQTLAYSIVGGADAALFSINASTGALVLSAQNYEVPADAGANNVYDVIVQASDGAGLTDTQAIAVTVTPVNDNAPVISSNGGGATASVSIAENTSAVTTVVATDADLPAQTLTYSISGGADAARFTINASTGVLSFVTAPDHELPADAGANNVYDVIVTASDGGGFADTQAIAVTVTPVNDNAPVISSNGGGAGAAVSVAENTTAVTTVTATDADLPAQTLTYSISGGADAARFTINASTGALTFVAAPDHEAPADAGANNVYDVIVTASDGSFSDTQAIAVTVTSVNDNVPVITSNGGGAAAAVNVAENTTAVTTVTATDADLPAQTLTYSISGGADAARFTINASTGALTFVAGPNFEAPADAGANNVYDVTVQVADGNGGVATQAIAVTVTNVNEAPLITSNGGGATASVSAAENQSAVTTVTSSDVDGGTAVYSIAGGTDAALFTINASTGVLTFVVAPNFEAPADVGANNVYDVTVQVADGNGGTDTQAIAVTVTNVNEAPVITSNGGGVTASVGAAENQIAVTTVTSTDVDGGVAVYSITGGADAALFTINVSTGALSFNTSPNFEAPADAGGDNVYDVTVQVADGNGGIDTQAIAVTVTNVNEAPLITSNGGGATASLSVAENQSAVTTVTSSDVDGGAAVYTIVGGADAALFTINASTGALSFVAAPNFEAPTDSGANNVYDVTVQVVDGNGGTDTQAIAVTVTNVNEAPVITSNGGGATAAVSAAENQTAVSTLTSTDVDGGAPSYSIVGGADAALFTINAGTGALTFVAAPNFEAPADAGANNVYDVTVQVADGNGGTDTQAIAVTVTNVNEAPVITSNGGGATAAVSAAENQIAVTTVASTDVDGGTAVYSIAGGADAALFTINASTGALTFAAAPNFEAPADAGGNNVYDVTVQLADGNGGTDTQAIAVTVTNVNEAPVITSDGGGATASVSAAETQTAVTTVTSSDVDGGTAVYSIAGGADAALFTINASTGALSFVVSPNFEAPVDAGGNNVYDVTVQVADGNGGVDAQAIAVTVTNVNEAPVITSNGGGATASISAAENQSVATTVTSSDVDGGTAVYSIAGGADAALFTINASTGALSFVAAPNFEAPADSGGNNVYDVTVQVADGNGGVDTQAIAVTVNDLNEAPLITSNGAGATAAVGVAENQTAVTTVTSSDLDGGAPSYAITGGADGALFTIDSVSGVLAFAAAPNFESPTDAGGNNVYEVTVQVADGNGGFDTQAISVTVSNVNEAPAITSNGGGASAAVGAAENQTAVTTITSADVDGGAPVYSIVGGADAARFTIDPGTGVLRFNTAPNYELTTDSDGDNVYDLVVQVSDGALTDTQAIAVTVTNVNEAPVNGVPGAQSTPEDTPLVFSVATLNAIGVNDTEALFDPLQVTLTASNGTLTLAGTTGLTFTVGSGSGDATMTFTGTRADINAALDGLALAPTADFNGAATMQITTDDQGFSGSGGPQSDTDSVIVNVTAVNDEQVLAANTGATVAEGSSGNVVSSAMLATTDVDNTAAQLIYTLNSAPANGTLRLSGVALAAGGSFTQADLDAGLIRYDHDGSETTADGFDFSVDDGAGSASNGTFAWTVTPVNDAPVIASDGGGASAGVGVSENSTAVTTVAANDADLPAQTLGYSIAGGADAALFAIDPNTGALSFVTAPNFESPTDAGGNNVYDVIVQVSDGAGGFDTQAIAVTVANVNEAPLITSNGGGMTAAVTVAENGTAATTVTSTDVDGGAAVYALSGGADAALFTINASTGVLSLLAAPNFEAPADSGGNNVYDVTVQVSDGNGGFDTQAIAVTVTNVNESPLITSGAVVNAAENQTAVTTVTSTDVDGGAPSYSIVGGADQGLFTIDAATGVLSFVTAPNFESPADAGGNNVYDVTVQVADGNGGVDTQSIAVTVTNVNEAPLVTSNGGGATAAVSAVENQTAVTTVGSTDVDGGAPSYSIVGGADAALFTIDSVSGALTFVTAPDFESPADSGGNNVYDVTMQVSDGNGGFDTQAIAVTVTNVNEAPLITSDGGGATANVSAAENQSAVTTVTSSDVDGGSALYSIAGGADAALFTINASTGALTFVAAPNFEAPADAGSNNVYDVTVQVSDGNGGTDTQAIAVTVTNVNEAPVITSNGGGASASVSAAENQSAVTTVTSSDVDGGTAVYSIAGGADAALFTINASTGALTFAAAPNFEAPADAGANNVYDVTVQVADGNGGLDTQAIAVTVTNVNEAPLITSNGGGATASISAAENQTVATAVTSSDVDGGAAFYSIAGGADAALFTIDASTGALAFVTAPNFESPTDAGADNTYDVTVQVADGNGSFDTQTIAVTVTNVNEAPVITSNGGGASANITAAENQTAVTTLIAADVDGGAPSYSIVGGADAALFTIDSVTGAVSFATAPDFESPTDAGGNGIYNLTVQVADGNGGFDTQALVVRVTNAAEAPVITSNGGGASAAVNVDENQTAVATVAATDGDADTPIYNIVGGADAALFSIDSATGVLTFNTAPNFEAPADADGNNVYLLTVQAADGNGGFDTQAISVTVRNINEAPAITSLGGGASANVTMAENQTAVAAVTSADVDGGVAQYSIVGGADAARFSIDAAAGTLSFAAAPDFEAPADANRDNVYDLMISVADGNGGIDTQTIAVAVSGVNEAPGNIQPASAALSEQAAAGTVVAIVTASDPDAGDLFTFTLVNDGAGRFVVDPASGRLQVAPGAVFDFESAPSHSLVLRVTDAQGLRTEQTIVVTLNDVAEFGPEMWVPDGLPPPAPAPAAAPVPTLDVPAIAPVVSSTSNDNERSIERESSATRTLSSSTDSASGAQGSELRLRSPQHGRYAFDGAPLVVASVSFAFDGVIAGGWSADALDGLLQQRGGDTPAPRFGLFALRGSSIEAEGGDATARVSGRSAEQAVLATLQDPVRVASATLTAGFVWWLTRSGGLLTSILMGIPAWRHVDLLPVLAPAREDDDDDGALGADSPDRDTKATQRDSLVGDLFSNTSRQFGESRFI